MIDFVSSMLHSLKYRNYYSTQLKLNNLDVSRGFGSFSGKVNVGSLQSERCSLPYSACRCESANIMILVLQVCVLGVQTKTAEHT